MGIKKIDLKTTKETVGRTSRNLRDGRYKKFVIGKNNSAAKESVFYNRSLLDSPKGAVRSINREESQDIWSSALEFAGYDGVLNEDEMKTMFQDWGYLPKDGETYEEWSARQAGEGKLRTSEEDLQKKWEELSTEEGAQAWFEKGQEEFTSYVDKQFGVDISQEGVEQTAEQSLAEDKAALLELAKANPDNAVLQDLAARATAEGADLSAIFAEAQTKIADGTLSIQTIEVTTKISSWQDVNRLLKDNYPGYQSLSKEEKSRVKAEFMSANPQYFKAISDLGEGKNAAAYDDRIINGYDSLPVGTKLNMPGGETSQTVLKTLKDMASAYETLPKATLEEVTPSVDAEADIMTLATSAKSANDILNASGFDAATKEAALANYFALDTFDPSEMGNTPEAINSYLNNMQTVLAGTNMSDLAMNLISRVDSDTKLILMDYVNDDAQSADGSSDLSKSLEPAILDSFSRTNFIQEINLNYSGENAQTFMDFMTRAEGWGTTAGDEFDAKIHENALRLTPAQVQQYNDIVAQNPSLTKIDLKSLGDRQEYLNEDPPYYTQTENGRLFTYNADNGRRISAKDASGQVEMFEYITDATTGEPTIRGSYTAEGAETPHTINTYDENFVKTGYETHFSQDGVATDAYYSIKDGKEQKDKDVTTKDGIITTNQYDHVNNTTTQTIEDTSGIGKKQTGEKKSTSGTYEGTTAPAADAVPLKSSVITTMVTKNAEGKLVETEKSKVESKQVDGKSVVISTRDSVIDPKTGLATQIATINYTDEGIMNYGELVRGDITYQISYEKKSEDSKDANGNPVTNQYYLGTMSLKNPATGAIEVVGSERRDFATGAVLGREIDGKDEKGNPIKIQEGSNGETIDTLSSTYSQDNTVTLSAETGVATVSSPEGAVLGTQESDGKTDTRDYTQGGINYTEEIVYTDKEHTQIASKVVKNTETGKIVSEEAWKDGRISTLTEYQEGVDKKKAIKSVTTYTYNDQGVKTGESKTVDGKLVSESEYEVLSNATSRLKQTKTRTYNTDGTVTIITKDPHDIPILYQQENASGAIITAKTFDPLEEAKKLYSLTEGYGDHFYVIDAPGVKNTIAPYTAEQLAIIGEAFEKQYGETIEQSIKDSWASLGGGPTKGDLELGAAITASIASAKTTPNAVFSDIEGFAELAQESYNTATGQLTDSKLIINGREISANAQQAASYMGTINDTELSDEVRKQAAQDLQNFIVQQIIPGDTGSFVEFMRDTGDAYRNLTGQEIPKVQTEAEVSTSFQYFFDAINSAAELVGKNDSLKAELETIIEDEDATNAIFAAQIMHGALRSEGEYTDHVHCHFQDTSKGDAYRFRTVIEAYSELYGKGQFLKDVDGVSVAYNNDYIDDFEKAYNQTAESRKTLMDEMVAAGSCPITQALAENWKDYPWFGESRVSDAQKNIDYGKSEEINDIAQYYLMCSTEPMCAEGSKVSKYITKSDLEWYLDKCKNNPAITEGSELAESVAYLQELLDDKSRW